MATSKQATATGARQKTRVSIFHTCADIPRLDWEAAAPKHNRFLQLPYLEVIEANPPLGMHFTYLLFYQHHRPIGVAIGQIQYFKADRSINKNREDNPNPCFFNTFARFIRGLVASKVEFNVLVVGNLLLTGEHGFYFSPEAVNPQQAIPILEEGLDMCMQELDKRKQRLSGILMKEFYDTNQTVSQGLKQHAYNEFTIQPSMVMDLRPEWNDFSDYLTALQSKYRVRVKRAFKKADGIEKRELDIDQIAQHLDQIYELYRSIASNSGFNMINLNKNYLLELKKAFPEDFYLNGYFLNGELVGFYTTLFNYREMEAHFLGFDQELNLKHQIYLNMLYDMVRTGIENNAERIVFARTALEIKSSVGAVAHEMNCYLRHRNAFTNNFVNPILEYLRPTKDWKPRHPFRENRQTTQSLS